MDKNWITRRKANEKECARIETFSDGVFAIAITLLILDLLEIPRPQEGQSLVQSYLNHWQSLMAFVVGFVTILVCWINHHHMFSHIEKFDSNLMWVNGLLLIVVTFTPFPTAILAEYVMKESNVAVALFGFTYFMMSMVYAFVWHYALSHNLLHEGGDPVYFRCIRKTYVSVVFYTFIAFFVCFLSIPAAILLYALMFGIFAYPKEYALMLYRREVGKNKISPEEIQA
jgi:uncharacterized membrane protein